MTTKVRPPLKLLSTTLLNALFISLFALSVIFFVYHLIFSQRVIPGVSVAGKINLGGKSFSEAAEVLRDKTNRLTASHFALNMVEASPSGKIFQRYDFYLDQVGVTLNADKTAEDAYRVGRTGSFIKDIASELQALWFGHPVVVAYRVDEAKLNNYLSSLEKDWGSDPREASFSFENSQLQLVPSHSGPLLGRAKVREAILSLTSNLDLSGTLTVARVDPAIKTEDLLPLKDEVGKVTANRIKIVGENKSWELSSGELLNLLAFKKGADGLVHYTPDRDRIDELVQKLAPEINEPSRGQLIEVAGTRVTKFIPGKSGRQLDNYQSANLISDALLNYSASAPISLPVREIPAPLASENPYGIKDLLGEGTTNFSGSIPGRIHNISLAANRLNGVLIPPGAVFSFNNSVGEVTERTGYDVAYIISEGRTVLGTGGGLCQVSSTIFRAALNSGLPIIKRTAHAYRVHYYEPPVGFDATVFSPSIDFQFSNDTPKYILVVSEIKGENLTFRLYGTSDGRQVEINGPFISREIAPPAPIYQDDPNLAAGVVQQVDWAAWGADVYFSRLVKRGGQTLQNDTFQSHYQAWQAIYLRGTRT